MTDDATRPADEAGRKMIDPDDTGNPVTRRNYERAKAQEADNCIDATGLASLYDEMDALARRLAAAEARERGLREALEDSTEMLKACIGDSNMNEDGALTQQIKDNRAALAADAGEGTR